MLNRVDYLGVYMSRSLKMFAAVNEINWQNNKNVKVELLFFFTRWDETWRRFRFSLFWYYFIDFDVNSSTVFQLKQTTLSQVLAMVDATDTHAIIYYRD